MPVCNCAAPRPAHMLAGVSRSGVRIEAGDWLLHYTPAYSCRRTAAHVSVTSDLLTLAAEGTWNMIIQ